MQDVPNTFFNNVKTQANIPSVEWQGNLANSVNSTSRFALYLAIYDSQCDLATRFTEDEDSIQESEITHFYKHSPLSMSSHDIVEARIQSNFIANQCLSSARLHHCMHPAPLHFRNNAKYINEDIIANCRYRTQHNFTSQNEPTESLQTDPAALAEIIPEAQSFMV